MSELQKFGTLLWLSLRSMLHTFSFGNGKKRAAGGVAAVAFLGGMALYLSAVYSFLLADMLASVGAIRLLPPLMALLACLMSLMFTLTGASSIVYGSKDSDLLLSLPVSAFSVMLSKISALYVENLLFCGLWMLPCCIAYGVYAKTMTASGIVGAVICTLFLPLLPTLVGILAGYIVAFFSARASHKSLMSAALYFILFGALFVGSLQMQRLMNLLLDNAATLERLFGGWLLPFGLMQRSITAGELSACALFCLVALIPFLLVAWLLSIRYKHILSSLSARTLRSDYRLRQVEAHGAFSALLRKEAQKYFGTTIYFFNTAFGVVLLIIGTVYLCFIRGQVREMMAETGLASMAAPMLCGAVCLLLSTVATSCVSISLEGKNFWILREAPLSARSILGAKAALNILVGLPVAVVCTPVAAWVLGISVSETLCILLAAAAILTHNAFSGLIANLLLPKMDAANETLVVKQSAAAFVGIFGGMILVGLWAGGYALLGSLTGFVGYVLLLCAVMAVLCAAEWHWLMRRGEARMALL